MNLLAVMQEVVSHVVADVPEDPSAVYGSSSEPIIEEDGVCQLPEWCCKDDEQCRRHNKAISVHWKVMVDPMEQEVRGDANSIIR